MSTPDNQRSSRITHTPLRSGRPAWKGGHAGLAVQIGIAVALVVALSAVSLLALRGHRSSCNTATRSGTLPPPASATTSAVATRRPVYRGLLIGINNYEPDGGSGWQPLKSARPDAEAIAATLQHGYGFQVRTLLDAQATRGAILAALDEFATTSGENDALLVYFAGHGCYDDQLKEGYWIPADARRTCNGRAPREDWLWNSTLTRIFSAAGARHVLVLADACYSGALFRGDQPLRADGTRNWYERAFARRSRYLITSGGLEPVLDNVGEHSVFAQQVLNYLNSSEHDLFSANDLGMAVRQKVADHCPPGLAACSAPADIVVPVAQGLVHPSLGSLFSRWGTGTEAVSPTR